MAIENLEQLQSPTVLKLQFQTFIMQYMTVVVRDNKINVFEM